MPPQLDKATPDRSTPEKLASDLRSAVLAGDHVRADRAAREYTEALSEFWEKLPASGRARSPLPNVARELLSWARGMTIVQRAIAAEQLASVQRTRLYQQERISRVRGPSSLQVRA